MFAVRVYIHQQREQMRPRAQDYNSRTAFIDATSGTAASAAFVAVAIALVSERESSRVLKCAQNMCALWFLSSHKRLQSVCMETRLTSRHDRSPKIVKRDKRRRHTEGFCLLLLFVLYSCK